MGNSNKIDITKFDPTNASDDQIRMWLFAIIQAEIEKDDSEIDQELIDECSDCEAFLSHNNPEISQEDYALGLAKIKERAQAIQADGSNVTVQAKPKKRRFVRVAVYFLAAALGIAILSVSVVAAFNGSVAWEFITTNIQQILGMEPGDTLESDKVTLVKGDLVAEYDSVEKALKAGGFEGILYPTQLPEGVKIERIVLTNDGDENNYKINFVFNSNSTSYRIFSYDKYRVDQLDKFEKISIQDRIYIIVPNTELGYYQAIFNYNGFDYVLTNTEYNDLLNILNTMEELQ